MRPSHAKPPLRSLQVFEAAARCGGFTAAGEELGITQSGVSRQVSDLEATLGVALFLRNGARLSLTPAGRTTGPPVGGRLRQNLGGRGRRTTIRSGCHTLDAAIGRRTLVCTAFG